MSGMNSDQLHRSTLGIYSSLMDEFNPNLHKLVSLGNSYVRAFQAFVATSEAYFSALSKIGEQAFHTMSSHSIGDVLIQISESQRRLTMELQGIFRWFTVDVLQEMDNNINLDKDYISGSRKHYEMKVHDLAAALERQRISGPNQDYSDYMQFVRESHGDALKEEERRYRFLAEKHCGLIQSVTNLMNKTGGSLQQRADSWTKEVNATRGPDAKEPTTVSNTVWTREDRRAEKSREEQPLDKIPSRAPSPQGSVYRSAAESSGGGRRSMRAIVSYQPGSSKPTLLPFTKGEMITVLVQQPKNGWLFGRVDGSSRQGWFPSSFVEEMDELPKSADFRSSMHRGNSMSNLFDTPGNKYQSAGPPPPPPPLPLMSSSKHSDMQSISPTSDRQEESNSVKKRLHSHGSRPELFPRGTNPFATVKLKPTSTNDRSGPRLHR